MRNYSYENDFEIHESETTYRTHFHMKGFAFRLGLKQTQEISEMAHSLDKQTVDSSFQLDQNILALL